MGQKQLYTQIKSIYGLTENGLDLKRGKNMLNFDFLSDAWLMVSEKGKIEDYGSMNMVPEFSGIETNCSGKYLLPCFVDSHTHLIHAGSRENEFIDRINGMSYQDIALKGGGILNSALKLEATSADELFDTAFIRLNDAIALGTGAIEIKSGYGLSLKNEIKMLKVANRLKAVSPIPIKITFLGAHAIPTIYKQNPEQYIKLIIEEMLPIIAHENLADYMDVFCEKNYFSVPDTEKLLEAGLKYGLKPKIHVNQFNSMGGIPAAIGKQALTVDHLEEISDEDILALQGSKTLPVLLPACSFFINILYAKARRMIDAGLAVALASDYNPGSSPCLSMPFVISLACTQMGLLPEEAFNAATLNGAFALQLQSQLGSIEKGKTASFILTKPVPSLNYLPYSFAENWVDRVVIN